MQAARSAQEVHLNRYKEGDSLIGIQYGTQIDNQIIYSGQLGELPLSVKGTYAANSYLPYMQNSYDKSITLYRNFGGNSKLEGAYLTTKSNATRSDLAVKENWSDMRFQATVKVPSGEILNVGKVAPQIESNGYKYLGGADQIVVRKNAPISKWTTTVFDKKTGRTYTIDEFKSAFPSEIKK